VIFIDDAILPLAEAIYEQIKDTVETFVYMSDKPGLPDSRIKNLVEYESLLAEQPDQYDWPYLSEDVNATLCYTTGTTGQPKGATFTHRQLYLLTLHVMAMQSVANIPRYDVERGLGVPLGENAVPMLNTRCSISTDGARRFRRSFARKRSCFPEALPSRVFANWWIVKK